MKINYTLKPIIKMNFEVGVAVRCTTVEGLEKAKDRLQKLLPDRYMDSYDPCFKDEIDEGGQGVYLIHYTFNNKKTDGWVTIDSEGEDWLKENNIRVIKPENLI